MKRQRRSDTAPELAVRRVVSAAGVGYRLNNSKLPGSPDLSNLAQGWAIFVHGCFWHGHRNCKRATVPKGNRAFWIAKIAANRARDSKKCRELRKKGLKVLTVWECKTRNADLLASLLRSEGVLP